MKAHTYYIIFGCPPIGGEASPHPPPLMSLVFLAAYLMHLHIVSKMTGWFPYFCITLLLLLLSCQVTSAWLEFALLGHYKSDISVCR